MHQPRVLPRSSRRPAWCSSRRANTAAELTTVDDKGLYFRTAPPDGLQAAALADVILRDGVRHVAIIYRDESYGSGLANSTKQLLMAAGLSDGDVSLSPYTAEVLPARTRMARST